MTPTAVSTPEVTPEVIARHGITPSEYKHIQKVLGRDPNFTELGVFSVMYSEHCSYKNSKPMLKLFPRDGKRVMVKAGEENAGVMDIGDGLCVAFKIESHNHPSAVEPFQGAATGVGGILRDIFTMGARPILIMNSLRFGKLESKTTQRLLRGVVGGISHYGNCIGVPTIGGEVYFDESYEGNPLVNALALGIARHDEIVRGKATGKGNPVFYLGATTGRDGMGGASFASKEISEESEKDRPAVQVGDPFVEKLLLEAVLELLKSGTVVGIQDMGAAGLTCSTCETAARGNSGIEIDTAFVPQRETGMIPYEILLSESQERMLVILKKGMEKKAQEIFAKWDLHAVRIGEVTDTGLMKVKHHGEVVVSIPAKDLADDVPLYIREEKKPSYLDGVQTVHLKDLGNTGDLNAALLKLMDAPNIASKEWVFRQYDHMVRTGTVFLPGYDSSLVRVKGTAKYLAVSTDCNSTYCYLDPYEGGKIAVAEAARNVAVSGAEPIGMTNCLNFGNPMKPEVFWQFHQCVQGMADACRELGTPVTGGNVSFYNESPKASVDPTPVVGVVGLIDGWKPVPTAFQKEGDRIILIGQTRDEVGGSEFVKVLFGKKTGLPPRLDLKEAARLNAFLVKLAKEELAASAHDLAEGGLAVALAECGILSKGCSLGAKVQYAVGGLDEATLLFSESQSRVLITAREKNADKIISLAQASGLKAEAIGQVSKDALHINQTVKVPLVVLKEAYFQSLRNRLDSGQGGPTNG